MPKPLGRSDNNNNKTNIYVVLLLFSMTFNKHSTKFAEKTPNLITTAFNISHIVRYKVIVTKIVLLLKIEIVSSHLFAKVFVRWFGNFKTKSTYYIILFSTRMVGFIIVSIEYLIK